MIRYLTNLILGLVYFQNVVANDVSLSNVYLGSREGDPTSLVENVSTIHGDYTELEVDLVVPAPDSLILSRFYSSRDSLQIANFGGWRFNPHCYLAIQKDPNVKTYTTKEGKFERAFVYVGNPDGTVLTYEGWQNVNTAAKHSLFKIDPEEKVIGLSNTAKGNISCWTNLKNNELYFNPQTDSFELLLCSEGKRFYAKHPPLDIYFLTHEILPSGNKVFYEFDEKGQLSLIRETNASEKKVLAWIKILYGNGVHVESSDGKTIDYHFQKDPSGVHLLREVNRADKPHVQYQYQIVDNRVLLIKKTLPEGRVIQIDYSDQANLYKVRSLTTPAGSNESASIQFSYGEGHTIVNGYGTNKAVYRFNEDHQLIAIEQYLDGTLYRVHKKSWGTKKDVGNLVSTSLEDANGHIFYTKSFKYDSEDKGNIIEEREYGNLTGADSTPLSIDEEGNPNQEGHFKTYSYFSGKNTHGFFQIDQKGTGQKCWYKKGTNLLLKKFILTRGSSDDEDNDSGIKKRYFYDYNEDAALIRTIVDDGSDGEAKQTYNVYERHMTLISPKKEMPNVGAPEIVEEKYLDTSKGKEVLLTRTINQFDAQGLVISQAVYDANEAHRYSLTKGYTQGLLSFETDPMGNETHYFYDANRNLTQISRSDTGISIEHGYDLRNRLIYTVEKDRTGNQFETQVTYDPAGYKIAEIDRFGNETIYTNDSLGRPIQVTYPEVREGQRSSIRPTYTYTYDIFDHLLSVTDPEGRLSTTSFNSQGNPTTIQHIDGIPEMFKYDHEGSLHRYLGKDGLVQVFEYDAIGRLNHIEYYKRGSKGSEEGFKRKYYNYDTFHLIWEKDEKEERTTYTYDGAGRLAKLTKGNQKVEFTYDALGRTQGAKKWKSSNDFTLELKDFDLLNRLIEQQTQNSQGQILIRIKYIYNHAGQLSQVISFPQNQESILTQYAYDGFGRLIKITGSSGATEIFYNDAYMNEWGQKTHQRTLIDSIGNQIEEIFDPLGHLIKVTKKDKTGNLLAETESFYDLSGHKILEKNARISSNGTSSYETEWSYNQADQLESITLGKGTSQERVTTFKYNSYGDLATKYNPGSTEPITYKYNTYGNLKTISYKEGKKEIEHKLSFDMNNNLTEAKLSSAQVLTYSYDPNNLPLSETIKDEFGSYQVTCTYDGEGNIQTLKLPDGSSLQYSYEGPFVQSATRFTKEKKELYTYQVASRDQMGNPLEEILPGHAGARRQAWDLSGRRVEISTDFFQDKIIEYNTLGHAKSRETTLDDEKSTTEYAYNDLSQLVLEKEENEHLYSYDSLGNRLQRANTSYKVDDLNQLLEAEGASYTFDAKGNLSTKTVGQKTWVYQWTPLNQLISIKDPDQNSVAFTYDLSGRRLTKKIETKGKATKTLRFFYLGNTELGSLDEKGALVELKVPHNPNHPEASCIAIEIKKEIYVPLYDLPGNIVCLLDHQKRKIVESYHYSAFGGEAIANQKKKRVIDSVVGNPWRYQGKRVDKEVGLIHFGQRYYDPEIGRWISPDPAGDIDGPNLYAFAHNNPITYVDYFGFAAETNENHSKDFTGYFYGEYEPHCHCESHRDCKRGGDIGTAMGSQGINLAGISHSVAGFILNNPRFQGTVQALGGLTETSLGVGMTLVTQGAAAPFGWPIMAHGLDQLFTGATTAFTGSPRETLTFQLLQKTGMPDQAASIVDGGLSIFGTMGATAAMRASQLAAFFDFRLPKHFVISSQENEQILFGQNSVSAFFSERGTFKLSPISEVVYGLKNGTIPPESLPIEIIIRNGQKITLNNRSLLALRRAGIEPKVIINRTGIEPYELLLNDHLKRNLPTDIIKVRGGPSGTSYIGPIK